MVEPNTPEPPVLPDETTLRSLAFNAVLPALQERGEWLPLSARQAVANAVVDAVMAVTEDEAINRMAETFVAESRLRAMDFRNGMKMDIVPAREIAAAWVAAARAMLGDAPNYAETPVEMETGLAGERERFAFTLQRVGKVTPHQARRAAEAERDAARASIAEVRKLHSRYRGPSDFDSCAHCNQISGYEIRWPCPTVAALDHPAGGGETS